MARLKRPRLYPFRPLNGDLDLPHDVVVQRAKFQSPGVFFRLSGILGAGNWQDVG